LLEKGQGRCNTKESRAKKMQLPKQIFLGERRHRRKTLLGEMKKRNKEKIWNRKDETGATIKEGRERASGKKTDYLISNVGGKLGIFEGKRKKKKQTRF